MSQSKINSAGVVDPGFPDLTLATYYFAAAKTSKSQNLTPEEAADNQRAFVAYADLLCKAVDDTGLDELLLKKIEHERPIALTNSYVYFALAPGEGGKRDGKSGRPLPTVSTSHESYPLHPEGSVAACHSFSDRTSISAGTVLDVHYLALFSRIQPGKGGLNATSQKHLEIAINTATSSALVPMPAQQILELDLSSEDSQFDLYQCIRNVQNRCKHLKDEYLEALFSHILELEYYYVRGAWIAPPACCSMESLSTRKIKRSRFQEEDSTNPPQSSTTARTDDPDHEVQDQVQSWIAQLRSVWILVHAGNVKDDLSGASIPLLLSQTSKVTYSFEVFLGIRDRQHPGVQAEKCRREPEGAAVLASLSESTVASYELRLLEHSLQACCENLHAFLLSSSRTIAPDSASAGFNDGERVTLVFEIESLRRDVERERAGLQLLVDGARDRLALIGLRRQHAVENAQKVVALFGSVFVPFSALQTYPLAENQRFAGFFITLAISLILLSVVHFFFKKADEI